MNPTETAFPPVRVTPNALRAFGGIWRLTFRRFLQPSHGLALAGMIAALMVIAVPTLAMRTDSEGRYLRWVIDFYLLFLVPVLSFISAAGAMRDELKATTVDYVFTRPVRRPHFVAFKYLSHLACAQLDFLAAFGAIVGLGVVLHVTHLSASLPSVLLGQILLITVFSAFGFLCAVITGRTIIIGLIYGSVIEAGVGQIPTAVSKLSMTHQVRAMLAPLYEPAAKLASAPGAWSVLLVLAAVSAVMLGVAAAIFSLRELSGPDEA
jgi:ABC-type transport system involved in multi-copper enzyme maturation permease subunit